MGGGFNDRADVQRTCRGMLGDGLKKHSSSLWPGKAAQGQLCGGGRGMGARHVYNKRQVIAAELCTLKTLECATPFYFVSYQKLFFIQFLSISVFITMLTC